MIYKQLIIKIYPSGRFECWMIVNLIKSAKNAINGLKRPLINSITNHFSI